MIAQQELQNLLALPLPERLQIVQKLIESAVSETASQVAMESKPEEISPAAKWLLAMAGRYSGGPGNTAERADEICLAEINSHSGFTLKEPLPE